MIFTTQLQVALTAHSFEYGLCVDANSTHPAIDMLIDLQRLQHCILTTQAHCAQGLNFSAFILAEVIRGRDFSKSVGEERKLGFPNM